MERAKEIVLKLKREGRKMASVESCTGGLLSAALTSVAGSSDIFECGYVTYSNGSKTALVGVPPELIEQNGAVSEEVARSMAEGARHRANVDIAVSITGIAGPGGATETKPVGLVHFACVYGEARIDVHHEVFPGDRAAVRDAAVAQALEMVDAALG